MRGNTLYQSAMYDGKCGGAPLVVHGKLDGLLIENNLIKEDKGKVSQYCYGLGVGRLIRKPRSLKMLLLRKTNF